MLNENQKDLLKSFLRGNKNIIICGTSDVWKEKDELQRWLLGEVSMGKGAVVIEENCSVENEVGKDTEEKALKVIENSFLGIILQDKGLKDVSFDGEILRVVTNSEGEYEEPSQPTKEDVWELGRELRSVVGKDISNTESILEVKAKNLRLIVLVYGEKTTFTMRVDSQQKEKEEVKSENIREIRKGIGHFALTKEQVINTLTRQYSYVFYDEIRTPEDLDNLMECSKNVKSFVSTVHGTDAEKMVNILVNMGKTQGVLSYDPEEYRNMVDVEVGIEKDTNTGEVHVRVKEY